jgi:glycosyltransferase involved in cell wall biosynthesis
MTGLAVSVVLCTLEPHVGRLQRTLDGLAAQALPQNEWELILVDNASSTAVAGLGLKIPPNTQLVIEPRPGLIHARLAGIAATRGDIIVFCDDDNVLASNYLTNARCTIATAPDIGFATGKSLPDFEAPPDPWMSEFFGCLALYDHGDDVRFAGGLESGYPAFVGGGCGAVFRREALMDYVRDFQANPHTITGRRGDNLTSGEDNDIVLTLLRMNWRAAYNPDLSLTHLISRNRLTESYLARLNESIARSWVKVLHRHGLSPWRPRSPICLPFQIARAYVRTRAWAGPAEYVRWRGACGHFRGRAEIYQDQRLSPAHLTRKKAS